MESSIGARGGILHRRHRSQSGALPAAAGARLRGAEAQRAREARLAMSCSRCPAPGECACGNSARRQHTMSKFITHDAIAAGFFNKDYVGGVSNAGGTWSEHLLNGDAVLELLTRRVEEDYASLPSKSRRPWTPRELDCRHYAECPMSFVRM